MAARIILGQFWPFFFSKRGWGLVDCLALFSVQHGRRRPEANFLHLFHRARERTDEVGSLVCFPRVFCFFLVSPSPNYTMRPCLCRSGWRSHYYMRGE